MVASERGYLQTRWTVHGSPQTQRGVSHMTSASMGETHLRFHCSTFSEMDSATMRVVMYETIIIDSSNSERVHAYYSTKTIVQVYITTTSKIDIHVIRNGPQ
jgi:hypothetical protein